MYNQKILSVFKNLKNTKKIKNANGVGKISGDSDIIEVYLRIDEEGKIEDASFKAFGSVATLVYSSVAIDFIKNKHIKDVIELDSKQICEQFGDFPPEKEYVFGLFNQALELAIKNYYKKIEKKQKEIKKALS